VTVLELHLEHSVRQRLRHDGVHHDRLLFLVAVVAVGFAYFFGPAWTASLSFGLSQDA
jgi:hypothetical protein